MPKCRFVEKRVTTLTNRHDTPNGDARQDRRGSRSLGVINYQPAITPPIGDRADRGMLDKRLKERRVAWARCERSIHYIRSIDSLSFPAAVVARSMSPLYRRAHQYGTRSFIIASVTNRFFPVTDIRESLDLEFASLCNVCVFLVTFSVKLYTRCLARHS